jgi:alkyldihydroxyacetonephosphate synthase
MARALEIVGDHGGQYDRDAVERSMSAEGSSEHRSGAAGAWREAFLRMPYWRDPAVGLGVIMDTFETAITWDRFDEFYRNVKEDVASAVRKATAQDVRLSCRITHLYPDGPAPYFTIVTRAVDGSVASALAAWCEIKLAANAAVVTHGGTITHHHAVGRDHRSGYEREVDPLFRQMLAAAKRVADPKGILNPGVLFDPVDRPIGQTGALAGG